MHVWISSRIFVKYLTHIRRCYHPIEKGHKTPLSDGVVAVPTYTRVVYSPPILLLYLVSRDPRFISSPLNTKGSKRTTDLKRRQVQLTSPLSSSQHPLSQGFNTGPRKQTVGQMRTRIRARFLRDCRTPQIGDLYRFGGKWDEDLLGVTSLTFQLCGCVDLRERSLDDLE